MSRRELNHFEQAASATAGALATSLFMTPLDVVKVRQQQYAAPTHTSAAAAPPPLNKTPPPSLITSLRSIARAEGLSALWAGLTPTLVASLPGTVLYLAIYDNNRELCAELLRGRAEWAAPMLAGGGARLVVSTAVSPLELIRTRWQAGATVGSRAGPSTIGGAVSDVLQREGPAALWRGLAPTLWRDVPFSCMYWLFYEALKKRAIATSPDGELSAGGAFVAGAVAGSCAAAVTTPLDVLKTRQQTALSEGTATTGGTATQLVRLARSEGVGALFAGLAPRLAKVAPSCAILIASYEVGKRYFGDRRALGAAPPALLQKRCPSGDTEECQTRLLRFSSLNR